MKSLKLGPVGMAALIILIIGGIFSFSGCSSASDGAAVSGLLNELRLVRAEKAGLEAELSAWRSNAAGKDETGQSYTAGKAEGYKNGKQEGYEEGLKSGKQDGYGEGFQSGRTEGYEYGKQDGRNEGRKIGYDEGYKNGKQDGYNEGFKVGYGEGYKNGKQDGYGEYKEWFRQHPDYPRPPDYPPRPPWHR